jgi:squalene-hopene/tetraprenyl-beta-curcumene cyclase
VPRGFSLEELLLPGTGLAFPKGESFWSRRTLFFAIDRVLKLWEHYGPRWLRRHATRRAESWMLERFEGSDGLGAIYPPMMCHYGSTFRLPEDHPPGGKPCAS